MEDPANEKLTGSTGFVFGHSHTVRSEDDSGLLTSRSHTIEDQTSTSSFSLDDDRQSNKSRAPVREAFKKAKEEISANFTRSGRWKRDRSPMFPEDIGGVIIPHGLGGLIQMFDVGTYGLPRTKRSRGSSRQKPNLKKRAAPGRSVERKSATTNESKRRKTIKSSPKRAGTIKSNPRIGGTAKSNSRRGKQMKLISRRGVSKGSWRRSFSFKSTVKQGKTNSASTGKDVKRRSNV